MPEDFEEKLRRDLELGFSEAFPNPNRIGCPPKASLKALARNRQSVDEAVRKHVTECSPCFREFLAFKTKRDRWRRSVWTCLITAAVCMIGFMVFWLGRELGRYGTLGRPKADSPGVLNFSFEGTRSSGRAHQEQVISRKAHELVIIVPSWDPPGQYELELRRASDNGLILQFRGSVLDDRDIRALRAQIDLTAVPPGVYEVLWHPTGSTLMGVGEFALR